MGLSGIIERLVAGRWIAGPEIHDAVHRAKVLNGQGMTAIINYLGEGITDIGEVHSVVDTYTRLIGEIKSSRIRADISLKPTELGIGINMGMAKANYAKIVGMAAKNRIFVWLDMEEYGLVADTVKLYKSMVKGGNTGICIQSYLRRSADDIKDLAGCRATIRLVKGAYVGPEAVAFQTREETTENYSRLMPYLFRHCRRFTIATHDAKIIEDALRLNMKYKREVTFAMLNGIRDRYAAQLARDQKVSVYVPFGEQWVKYSYRRIKEMSNFILVARSLFGG